MSDFSALSGLVGRLPTNFEETSKPGEIDKNGFMKLLVEQMRHQDPMNPMDSQEYSANLAQFTQLEELQNMNTLMDQTLQTNILLAQSINNTMAAGLVGKEIEAVSDQVKIDDGEVSPVSFELRRTAPSVQIEILDAEGNTVRTLTQEYPSPGVHTVEWDGKNEFGQDLTDGNYTARITRFESDGSKSRVNPLLVGTVDGVRFDGAQGATLVIDGVNIGFGDVLEVRNPETGESTKVSSLLSALNPFKTTSGGWK